MASAILCPVAVAATPSDNVESTIVITETSIPNGTIHTKSEETHPDGSKTIAISERKKEEEV
jgi:hypothetical protein